MDVKLEKTWKERLLSEFKNPYFLALTKFIKDEYKSATVYPHPKNIFRAFDLCPFDQVKVVILGQDPYHGRGQANGLCFAVNEGITVPPSLRNIFKEITSDLGREPSEKVRGGDLTYWAEQGVLLLNATLTVQAGMPGSHQGKGWEEFTDKAIQTLSHEKENLVFLLWGNYAKKKGAVIDRNKHLVLESAHPSPFSADSGFFGSKHFSKTNEYLLQHNKKPIDW